MIDSSVHEFVPLKAPKHDEFTKNYQILVMRNGYLSLFEIIEVSKTRCRSFHGQRTVSKNHCLGGVIPIQVHPLGHFFRYCLDHILDVERHQFVCVCAYRHDWFYSVLYMYMNTYQHHYA